MHKFTAGLSAVAALVMAPQAAASPEIGKTKVVADLMASGHATDPALIDIELYSGAQILWQGSLLVAAPQGNASYSQSKSEFAGNCDGRTDGDNRKDISNENLRLSINRRYSGQQTHQFSLNVHWTRAVPPCEGGGSNSIGFERPLTLPPGASLTLAGEGGLSVRIRRQR